MALQEVPRYKHLPLKFTGALLKSVRTEVTAFEGLNRWLELALYQRQDDEQSGGYVTQLKFCSDGAEENMVSLAEQLDGQTDVENFFFAFEPTELLSRANVRLKEDELRELATLLYSQYELAVRDVLAALPPRKESQSDAVTEDAIATNQASRN